MRKERIWPNRKIDPCHKVGSKRSINVSYLPTVAVIMWADSPYFILLFDSRFENFSECNAIKRIVVLCNVYGH